MLIANLFDKVLVQPAKDGADKLLIVSGYATANMADRHIRYLNEKFNANPSIKLIHGMIKSGISKIHHKAFQNLSKSDNNFSCYYLTQEDRLCHAKVFVWLKNKEPFRAFVGSANYTLTAFGENQIECVVEADPVLGKVFYSKLFEYSVYCNDKNIENDIQIIVPSKKIQQYDTENVAKLPLIIERTGKVHETAGLNWGQREGREPNQAYIPIPIEVRRRNFFPCRKKPFTVLTDDNQSFIMVVAQDGSKALLSTENNSLIGRYFRHRLGLEEGVFVTDEHLRKYGRLDVDFVFIEPETYYMDFSVDTGTENEEHV